jgi:hypothetical protein
MPSIQQRIFRAAEELVQSQDLEFGLGAGQDLMARAEKAALDIEILPWAQGEARIREAEAAFRLVAARMLRARLELPGYAAANPGIVGEDTLHWANAAALGWPFD